MQPMNRDDEINAFKQEIDLRSYAEANGFVEDRRASSVNSTGFKHPATDDKILVSMGHDDNWIFYAVRPLGVKGSIIDLDQHLHGGTLGDVRKRLRPWLDGQVAPPTPPPSRPARLKHTPVDLEAVKRRLSDAQSVYALGGVHGYLNGQRGLTPALLAQERFKSRILIDGRGNGVFPHYNADKRLCGAEIKNDGFTGFTPQGQKGLWITAGLDGDHRFVLGETAIDALSYAQLFDDGHTRYGSIAGQMSPHQPGILFKAFQALPQGSEIVLAFDHDDGGQALAEFIEPIFEAVQAKAGRHDLTLCRHAPKKTGNDWNDEISGDLPGGLDPRRDPPPCPA